MPSSSAIPPCPPGRNTPAPWTASRLFKFTLLANGRWKLLLVGCAGFILHQVSEALVPATIGAAVDKAIAPHDAGALLWWLGALAVVFVVLALSWRIGTLATNRSFLYGSHDLRQLAVERTLHPRGMAARRAPGEIVAIASSDADRVAGLSWLIGGGLAAAAGVATSAVTLLLISVPLGIAVLVATPVMLVVMQRLTKPLEDRSDVEQSSAARAGALATDFVTGSRPLKGLGAEEAAVTRYQDASRTSLLAGLRAVRARSAYNGASTALSAAFLAGIAFFAAWFAVQGSISVGQLVAVVGVAQYVQGPMAALGFLSVELARKRASAARIAVLLEEPDAVPAPGDGDRLAAAERTTAAAGSAARPTPAREPAPLLELRDSPDNSAFPPFTASAGEIVGVVLPDGSQARRLVDTLGFRTPAPRGAVSIDGHDAADLDPLDVRSKVFADSHEGVLFRGTVRDNVAAADAPLQERALAAAAVEDFISQLPEGTETVLTGHGQSLSGGQRQRLVLGRSLHQHQPVLVLHDPTTAVDTATEAVIAEGLRNFPDKALVLVTTSPTLLAVCHRVVVGGADGASETGTHRELLATSAGYREVVGS
ncbi:ABC transporter ATP-binding protein [Paenarthrobacter sp. OM7]|uniref:ABC transporter ATP-binding protein n=1 Tax=Micrococcaceae TaxID=1268 RepID=UPI001F615400|nr:MULTISPECIES: ABC transporter ATP-binding protein [Micrococcaceae]WGM21046.1 ABC transporter ATP-binding protein [Paenarthrobacter sp. OM7]